MLNGEFDTISFAKFIGAKLGTVNCALNRTGYTVEKYFRTSKGFIPKTLEFWQPYLDEYISGTPLTPIAEKLDLSVPSIIGMLNKFSIKRRNIKESHPTGVRRRR